MSDFAPKDNLIRASFVAGSIELRDAGEGTGSLLVGHFSRFNEWYPISSYWEGDFLERIAPGAFADTIRDDRSSMRVLYDHGFDPELGNKPLGPIRTLEEDDEGPYYEVPLLDTSYNRDFVIPALRGRLMTGEEVGSQLGASFRFQVQEETLLKEPKTSSANPKGLPERTITRAKVFEFGPVTFPANAGASAGVRSLSDDFIDRLHHDPRFIARFTERAGVKAVEQILSITAPDGSVRDDHKASSAADGPAVRTKAQRRALALALDL